MNQLAERIAGRPFPEPSEEIMVSILDKMHWVGDFVLVKGVRAELVAMVDEEVSKGRHNPGEN